MTLYMKLIAGGVAALLLFGLVAFGLVSIYEKGKHAGESTIQARWDADKAAIAKVTADALARAQKSESDALEANSAIKERYDEELADIRNANDDLSTRLHNAEALAARRGPVPQAPGVGRAPDPGTPPGVGSLTDALAAALTESAGNRFQLDALIAQVRRQL